MYILVDKENSVYYSNSEGGKKEMKMYVAGDGKILFLKLTYDEYSRLCHAIEKKDNKTFNELVNSFHKRSRILVD